MEGEVGTVLCCAGEEGAVFGCLREGCKGVLAAVCVCVGFEVCVYVGYGFSLGLWYEGVRPGPVSIRHLRVCVVCCIWRVTISDLVSECVC